MHDESFFCFPPGDDRRGFLAKAVAVVCGLAACAAPAAAGLVAFLNPLREKSAAGGFRRLTSLDVLPEDGSPRKFPVFAQRSDAWNTFPNEAVGAVFIRRVGGGQVEAMQVVCPHAGCFVAFDPQSNGFSCPCHAARFDISGKRLDPAGSPSPRDLDTLQTKIRNGTEVLGQVREFPHRHSGEGRRIMNALLSWIDERTELCSCTRDWLGRPVAGGPAWRNVWPATIAFMFFTQAVTGIVLWMYYSPGAQNAWESVYYLQSHVLGGWLLRAVHHYAAQVMLVLVGIYLVHTIVCRTYRAPREFVFWIIVCSGLLVLALNLTGNLLPWDQNGFWSTRVRTGFLLLLPGVGGGLFKLAIGGPSMGNLTLTRFFALHAGVLPAILLGLLVLHAWLGGRGGNGGKSEKGGKGGNGEKGEIADPSLARRLTPPARLHPSSLSYWPHQAMRDALACLAVLAVVIGLSLQHGVSGQRAGVELGAPANPVEAYAAARPEWSFRGLYEFAHLFPARLELLPIFVIPGLIVLVVLLMPWIGRRWLGQWFNVGFISLLLVGLVVLSWRSLARDAGDPEYQKALAAGQAEAQRARSWPARRRAFPPAGRLACCAATRSCRDRDCSSNIAASPAMHTRRRKKSYPASRSTRPPTSTALPLAAGWPACSIRTRSPARNTSATRG